MKEASYILFSQKHIYREATLEMNLKAQRLSQCSIAMKRRHDHSNSYKVKHFLGARYSFRGLVHYLHDGKHGSMQADMALDRCSWVFYIWIPRQQEERVTRYDGYSWLSPWLNLEWTTIQKWRVHLWSRSWGWKTQTSDSELDMEILRHSGHEKLRPRQGSTYL